MNTLLQQALDALGEEWQPCCKLPVTVHVRKQRPGEAHVSTREGLTPVKPDDLIMRGVQGEEYPIGREIFERTYRMGEAPVPVPDGWVMVPMEPTPEMIAAMPYPANTIPTVAAACYRAMIAAHGITGASK